jgi:hypothetical protein
LALRIFIFYVYKLIDRMSIVKNKLRRILFIAILPGGILHLRCRLSERFGLWRKLL